MKNKTLLLLLLIILTGTVLRFAFLASPSIRGDEGPALFMSERPFGELWENTKADSHPPLFYLVLRFVPKVGEILPYRMLVAILSIAVIPVAFLLGKKLFSENVGLFTAFMFSISQVNIKYAQMVRSYSLLTLLAMLSIYFFISYLKDRETSKIAWWVVFSALACWTHFFMLFVLVAEVAYILSHYLKDKKLLKSFFFHGLLLAVLIVPLVPLFQAQSATIKDVLAPIYQYNDPLLQPTLTTPISNNILVRNAMMFFHLSVGYHKFAPTISFAIFFALTLLAFGLPFIANLKNPFKDKHKLLPLALFLSVPIFMSLLWITKFLIYHTYARYLLFVSPLYYLFISKGIFNLKNLIPKINLKKVAIVFAILILALNAVSLYGYYTSTLQRENFKYLTSKITGAGPEDVIIVHTGFYSQNIERTYKGEAQICLGPDGIKVGQSTTLLDYLKAKKPVTEENKCNILECTDGADNIWLMQNNPSVHDSEKLLKNCLENNFKLENTYSNTYINAQGEEETDFFLYEFAK